eukprot:CAMPEP_0172549192 /NCGR_PEP_ID=MMETSP1067-20121228/18338_1 /TAXON_ID=265564 ORGANISM="Thalassiosira punctigera, Strain Tpunct2005C2" /NCGR_SAMPLE_ID=MMETSP1067 /ASSEMBLY_ACC=CAM_ASM_000444 /LENGTH=105 /DNA_ID=CAMNT_0013336539 /DNA_START=43 /DNA_END=357 /DNA_ORIENTATION=+
MMVATKRRRRHKQKRSTVMADAYAKSSPALSSGGVIGGQAFYDSDNDGMRDANVHIHGVGDINVWLLSCDSPKSIAHYKTASDGNFRFANLPPGNYFITAQPPAG